MADDIVSSLAPVRKSVVVPLTTSNAFDLFFRRLPEWWPLITRSVSQANVVSCIVETSCGGRLF
jgi:hypothetical protein